MKKLINFYSNLNHVNDIYYTQYKDSKPYKVVIGFDDIIIYNNIILNTDPICKFTNINKLFIGTIPKNKKDFQQNYGKKFNGNSILIETESLTYAYIGNSIFVFQTDSPIISYTSNFTDNGIPTPCALDKENKIYSFENSKYFKNNIISTIHTINK